jgi:hypothetical protein
MKSAVLTAIVPSAAGAMPLLFSASRNFWPSALTGTSLGPGKSFGTAWGCSGGAVAASPGLVTGAEADAEADAPALGAADAELSAVLDAAADVVALVDGLDVAVESSLPHPTNNPLAATASAPTAIARRKVVLIRECCGIYSVLAFQVVVSRQGTDADRAEPWSAGPGSARCA